MKQEVKSKSKGKAKHTEMSDVWLLEEDEGVKRLWQQMNSEFYEVTEQWFNKFFLDFEKKRKSNNM